MAVRCVTKHSICKNYKHNSLTARKKEPTSPQPLKSAWRCQILLPQGRAAPHTSICGPEAVLWGLEKEQDRIWALSSVLGLEQPLVGQMGCVVMCSAVSTSLELEVLSRVMERRPINAEDGCTER